MGIYNVNTASGVIQVNTGTDNRVDPGDAITPSAAADDSATADFLRAALEGTDLQTDFSLNSGTPIELKDLLEKIDQSLSGSVATAKGNAAKLKALSDKLKNEFDKAATGKTKLDATTQAKKAALDAAKGKVPPVQADINLAQMHYDSAKASADANDKLIAQIKTQLLAIVKDTALATTEQDGLQAFLKDRNIQQPNQNAQPELSKGKAGTANIILNSGSESAGGGRAAGYGPGAFGMPGGAQGSAAAFDPAAWYQSSMYQDNRISGMDQISSQQMKAQKMMMLFFYFARQAMSGDMGAMYQFMRFVAHFINHDKAQQNIAMAEKLIQLQDASRKATKLLLDQPSYDPENQQVGADFSKMMEKTKADQGEIATSQKLIAQMLEEFGQVSEMMTGMVKSLLDARGRELNMVAVWRA